MKPGKLLNSPKKQQRRIRPECILSVLDMISTEILSKKLQRPVVAVITLRRTLLICRDWSLMLLGNPFNPAWPTAYFPGTGSRPIMKCSSEMTPFKATRS